MSMKKILAGLSFSLASAVASAAIWSQTIDFNPDMPVPPSQTWKHDLGTEGFRFGYDQISSFSLSVRIVDRATGGSLERFLDLRSNLETAVLDLPGGNSPDAIWIFAIGTNQYNASQTGGLLALNNSGELTIGLDTLRGPIFGNAIGGNFLIAESTLTAEGVLPEPGALALVGVALLGVGLSSRRQARAG